MCRALSFRNQERQGLYHVPTVFMVGLYLSIYEIAVNHQFFSDNANIDCSGDVFNLCAILNRTYIDIPFHTQKLSTHIIQYCINNYSRDLLSGYFSRKLNYWTFCVFLVNHMCYILTFFFYLNYENFVSST